MSKVMYTTKAGSTVTIIGKYGKGYEISFDWFEEDDACIECVVDGGFISEPKPYLAWICDYCGGGWAELTEVENVAERVNILNMVTKKRMSVTLIMSAIRGKGVEHDG